MSDDLVKRLRYPSHWLREGFRHWKDAVRAYDPTPFEAADRIEELEAQLAVAGKALNRLLRPPNGHPYIEAATKEEWAVRAMNAEDKLAKVIEDLEQKLCDYCDEADPMRQAMCLAKECGVKDV